MSTEILTAKSDILDVLFIISNNLINLQVNKTPEKFQSKNFITKSCKCEGVEFKSKSNPNLFMNPANGTYEMFLNGAYEPLNNKIFNCDLIEPAQDFIEKMKKALQEFNQKMEGKTDVSFTHMVIN